MDRIIEILYKRLAGGRLSEAESAELDAWIAESPGTRRRFVEEMADRGKLAEEYRLRSQIDSSRPHEEMRRRLGIRDRKPFNWKVLLWSAASVILGLCCVGILMWDDGKPSSRLAEAPRTLTIEQLTPGAAKAIVTLPGGDTIRVENGLETLDLSSLAKKTNGRLAVDVPRGGEFIVVLEDSTRVWLNSESRLVYPEHFASAGRRVQLEGEAYFDVTHSDTQPFFVETAGQQVRVYGTEFNIRSYPEDKAVYTTLSEGSVSLSRLDGQGGEIFLSPGKQAVFDKESREARVRPVDIETVTGWRHGRFVFEEQTLGQIMRDLSRWYDFDFEFADAEAAETVFMGSIPRYSNFKTAIAILEKSGGLKFTVEDNRLVIRKNHF